MITKFVRLISLLPMVCQIVISEVQNLINSESWVHGLDGDLQLNIFMQFSTGYQ